MSPEAARNPPDPKLAPMDNLTPSQRSQCMSRVRTSGTDLEQLIEGQLRGLGLRYRRNDPSLPGKPDFVFLRRRVAVFVDGDFWHGYRFPVWKDQLSLFWQAKIESNRRRDRRNFRKLRKSGWNVVRLLQHQIRRDPQKCLIRITNALTVSAYDPRDSRHPCG